MERARKTNSSRYQQSSNQIDALFADAVGKVNADAAQALAEQKVKSEAQTQQAIAKIKLDNEVAIAKEKARAKALEGQVAQFKSELAQKEKSHAAQMADVQAGKAKAIADIKAEHQEQSNKLKADLEEQIVRVKSEAEGAVTRHRTSADEAAGQIEAAKAQAEESIAAIKADYEAPIAKVRAEAAEKEKAHAEQLAKAEAVKEKAIADIKAEHQEQINKLKAELEEQTVRVKPEANETITAEEAEAKKAAEQTDDIEAKAKEAKAEEAEAEKAAEQADDIETKTEEAEVEEAAEQADDIEAKAEEAEAEKAAEQTDDIETKAEEAKVEKAAEQADDIEAKAETKEKSHDEETAKIEAEVTEKPVSETIGKMVKSSGVAPGDEPVRVLALCAQDIMHEEVIWIDPEESVKEALDSMEQHKTGYLMVGHDGALEGIVSESDLKGALSPYLQPRFSKWRRSLDYASLQIRIKWVMSKSVRTIRPEASVETIMKQMWQFKLHCLPVVDADGKLRGLVTETEVFKALARSKESRNTGASEKERQIEPAAPEAPERTGPQEARTQQASPVPA